MLLELLLALGGGAVVGKTIGTAGTKTYFNHLGKKYFEDDCVPGVNYKILRKYLAKLMAWKDAPEGIVQEQYLMLTMVSETCYQENKMHAWKKLEKTIDNCAWCNPQYTLKEINKVLDQLIEEEDLLSEKNTHNF